MEVKQLSYMTSFGKRCRKLRRQNKTLPEIMEITGRPKTSVYYHIKNIPLSEEKRKEVEAKTVKKLRKHSKDKKGRSKLGRSPNTFNKWTESRAMLIGHLLFDGEVERGYCKYSSSHGVLVNRVVELTQTEMYPYHPKRRVDSRTEVIEVAFYNVELGTYVLKKQKNLLNKITELSPDNQLAFLTAFFDDEGCIDFKPETSRRRVRGYQNGMEVLEIVQKLLSNFSINSTIRENTCNEIVISRRKNLKKFQEKINFSPGVKINSDRANSVWNESLEKREILARAINSYQT
jgi:intein/homing endonuclease